MKTFRKSILVGLTVLGLGTAGLAAQAQDAAAPAHSQQERAAKHAERWNAHMAKLHDALKLSAAQESAWAAFRDATQPQPPARPDRAAMRSMTAPARLEAAIEASKAHTAAMESHLAALKTFYAQLTPEQQKTLDQMAMHHMMQGRHMMHGQHMMQRGAQHG